MAARRRASLDEAKRFYAEQMAAASRSDDPRFVRAFELVPREAFLPPGPWRIRAGQRYVETPSADPVFLYQNSLVAIDVPRGINNGEPFLHAAWIGAVDPKPGETVSHIGAGTGYYSALLGVLVLPEGTVHAYEIEEDLAATARQNLQPFGNASVTHGDATQLVLPASDIVYVNAGVIAPPSGWLNALRPGGRLIFPWRPAEDIGLTVLVRRTEEGFAVKPLMPSWFIPCVGASSGAETLKPPTVREARTARSIWLAAEKDPDDTAVAIYRNVWFSSAA
jgi:protein-L-isoaspartate(D-aspartate) O-methyltransferase